MARVTMDKYLVAFFQPMVDEIKPCEDDNGRNKFRVFVVEQV
jgi:CRISPR/Cas system CSM-associated protein Csm2 small subunit